MINIRTSVSAGISRVLPRLFSPVIGRSAIRASALLVGLSGALVGPTNCVTKGDEYACLANKGLPKKPTVIPSEEKYDYNNPDRGPYTWTLIGNGNCDNSPDGLIIKPNYGEVTTQIIAEDGSLTATIAYRFDEHPSPIIVKIISENGEQRDDIELYPPEAIGEGIVDNCATWPSPSFVAGYDLGINYADINNLPLGLSLTISFAKNGVKACDDIIGNDPGSTLKAYFIVENAEYPADADDTHFILSHPFQTAGAKSLGLKIVDTAHQGAAPAYKSLDVYVSGESPSLSIIAPYSGTVNNAIAFAAGNPGGKYDYSFNFNDGTQPTPGTFVNHIFDKTGAYGVVLSASLKSDPDVVYDSQPFNINIVPYPVPNVGINGPTNKQVNMPVDLSVPNPTSGATYTWKFGDNTSDGEGTSVQHTYTSTGTYLIELTGDINGSTNSISQQISIW